MLPMLLAGCSITHYRDGSQSISRVSLGVNSQIGTLSIRHGKYDRVHIMGFTGNQTEGLKAAAEGAVVGLKTF